MRFHVTFDRGTAFVEGPKTETRRRLAACGDTSPIWTGRRKGWATSTAAANKLIEQLEARNVQTIVEDTAQGGLDLSATEPANMISEQGGLW